MCKTKLNTAMLLHSQSTKGRHSKYSAVGQMQPLSFLIYPAKPEEIMLIVSNKMSVFHPFAPVL